MKSGSSDADGARYLVTEESQMVDSEFFVGEQVRLSSDGTVTGDGGGSVSPFLVLKPDLWDEAFYVDRAGSISNFSSLVAQ
jgi:hypothetical protein